MGRPDRRYVVILAAVGSVLLLAALGAIGVAAVALPGCEGCHFERDAFREATVEGTHGDVSCVSCHVRDRVVPRAKFGLYQAYGMWVPILDPAASDVAVASDEQCLTCHEGVQEGTLESAGLRIEHASCAEGRTCVDCHSEVGHGPATTWPRIASMNDCVTCHKKTKNSLECKTCHTGKVTTVRFSKPEFAVTHGENWRKTHGMGQMATCSVCHDERKCSGCHGPGVPHTSSFVEDHATYSTRSDAECTSCHLKEFCSDCHGTEMPHPKRFASGHSRLVKKSGDAMCLRCHAKSDCEECHVKHVHPGGAVGRIPSPAEGGTR